MATYGIDISKHQGALDFKAIAKENKFVILRIGFGVSQNQKDPRFEEYYKKAKAAGLKIGGYYYSYALTVSQAKQEAKNCLEYIKGKEFDMPIFFDMEDADGYKKKKGMPSSKNITAMCNAFCEAIEAAGYKAGVYASTSWYKAKGVGNTEKQYTRWEARYGKNDGKSITKNLYNKDVPMHQYTSADKGKYGAGGKSIKVDRNINYSIAYETRPKKVETAKVTKPEASKKAETQTKLTAEQTVAQMKADYCKTAGRTKKNGVFQNYKNKYTEFFGALGYEGINKDGTFSKLYSYGTIGHCALGVQYHLYKAGYSALIPKSIKYGFNTNVWMDYLKTEPNGVKWTSDPKKAKLGAVAFKGDPDAKKASHTCVFISFDGTNVTTVDFNVSDGKMNNGTINKRNKKYFKGFANLPYYVESNPTYKKNEIYTLQSNMYVRADHSKSTAKLTKKELSAKAQLIANSLGILPKGTEVTCLQVWTDTKECWIRIPSGWVCGYDQKKIYVK